MPTTIEGIKFYTITDVATSMHVTPQTVRRWIKEKKIRAQRIGRPILITEKNLRAFLEPSLANGVTSDNMPLQK